MRLCVWDVSGGRSQVVDSLWTGSVSFCQAATLQSSAGSFLLAFPGEQMEEVRRKVGGAGSVMFMMKYHFQLGKKCWGALHMTRDHRCRSQVDEVGESCCTSAIPV